MLLDSITKACRLVNDTVYQRRPIQKGLLEQILFEVECIFSEQYYHEILYKAAFILAYYGLLRVGELAADLGTFKSNHAIKTCNIHVGENKPKILLVLHSSKTHGKESLPQKIKISAKTEEGRESYLCHTHFCPFAIMREYMRICGTYDIVTEQLFIFRH